MNNALPQSQPLATFLSWAILLLALACLALLAWYIPMDRAHFLTLFRDFKVELPAPAKFVLSVPDAAFRIAAGVIGLAAFTLQCLIRSKSNAALLHMLIIVLCCLVFTAYHEVMAQPLFALMQDVSGPAGR